MQILRNDGEIFLMPTVYDGAAAMRLSIINWPTTERELAWKALQQVAAQMSEV